MKCKSCREDIPPKFTHALSVNICPLCGQEIMDVKLQNILGELKTSLNSAQEYMEEVEDWLFSNFSLKKVKPNEIVVDKNQLKPVSVSPGPGVMVNRKEDDEEVVVDEKPSTTTVFAKRAGVISPKKALDFIKGRSALGAADPSEFEGVDDEYGEMEMQESSHDDNLSPLNPNERNQMAGIFRGEDLAKSSHELEMQKLKRLQAQNSVSGGGGGIFRRN